MFIYQNLFIFHYNLKFIQVFISTKPFKKTYRPFPSNVTFAMAPYSGEPNAYVILSPSESVASSWYVNKPGSKTGIISISHAGQTRDTATHNVCKI